MKAFLVALIGLCASVCEAQYVPLGALTMWTDGYVITIQNDTIRGQVRVGSFINDSPAGIIIRKLDDSKIKVKGSEVRLLAQRLPEFAYTTGNIPREREMVVFERVSNPRRNNKPMLLERLTPFGGSVALYVDVAGWKKTTEYSFGNFVLAREQQDLSYIVLKNGTDAWLAKRGEMETVHEKLFGDCPAFLHQYPIATRRSWPRFGEMVAVYNELCQQQ